MTKHDVYQEILRGVIRDDMSREEILWVGFVLHTHSIALRGDVEVDGVPRNSGTNGTVLAPLTRSHVAQMLSSLWQSSDPRGHIDYWSAHYYQTVAYEVFEDVPDGLRDRAIAARDNVLGHDLIERLIEE